ncbi:hypothetical protein NM688_g7295 [Phlebia brevispora]|uniref:Uncharacterized protein n=1 Tax=Phlebia brevispora TaxID=194682 RepID=A0ACC1S6V4_9APHY|nr:hypothetical protein NM688_g7295 [Phlebia brevispora]
MVGTTSKSSHNLSGSERGVDDMNYNPQADARSDNAAFDPNFDNEDFHPVGARGAGNQPTGRNWEKEDQETSRSDQIGQIPPSEVDDLLNSATSEEKGAQSRTRGVKNDAWKQDRELDNAFVNTGLAEAD